MPERPAAPTAVPHGIRVEVLKELQQLLDSREARERMDRSPLAEIKGREHWVLHLLLRAQETEQVHTDQILGSVYSNLLARLQTLEDRIARIEELEEASETAFKTRLEALERAVSDRVAEQLGRTEQQIEAAVARALAESLDRKWKPVGESIENFARDAKQLVKGVDDAFRISTQNRLLLNENARRLTDLGRDLVALEESLKFVFAKTLEERLAPIERRLASLDSRGAPMSPIAQALTEPLRPSRPRAVRVEDEALERSRYTDVSPVAPDA
jgi:hypothetical protein